MTDFYKIGSGLGDAYLEGRKFKQDREKGGADIAYTRANTDRVAGLAGDEAYNRARNRGFDAQYDADTAPAPTAAPDLPPAERGLPAPRSIGSGHRALAADALRRRDGAKFAVHTADAKTADAQDAFQKGSTIPDEDIDKLVAQGNQSKDFPVLMHKDKKGYEIITTRPDGSTSKVTASPEQMRQIMGYRAMMGVDAPAALKGIAGINADLATAFGVRLKQLQETQQGNNTATHYGNQDEIARDNTAAKIEVASMRAETAALRLSFAKEGKTIPPAMLEKLNTAAADIDNETDPQKKAQMAASFRRQLAIAGTTIGKLTMPAEPKEVLGMKVNADGSVIKDGALYVPDPKKPGKFTRADIGPSALERALTGERPATGTGVPAPHGQAAINDGTGFVPASSRAPDPYAGIDPATLVRTAKRGTFGGTGYVYKDPRTGAELSTDDYNRLLSK